MHLPDVIRAASTHLATKYANPRADQARNLAFASHVSPVNAPQPDERALLESEIHNPVLWRSLDVKGEDAVGVPLVLTIEEGGKRRPVDDHDALRFVMDPGPDVTYVDFWHAAFTDQDAVGDFFGLLYKNSRGMPESMERLLPSDVLVVPDTSGVRNILGYKWDPRGAFTDKAIIPREDMFHVKGRNPVTNLRGLGRLVRLRMLIRLDRVMQDWNWNRYSKGIPTEYLIFWNGTLLDDEREMVEDTLRGKFGPEGDPWLLVAAQGDGNAEWKIEQFPRPTEDELAFLNSEQRIMYRISMAMGVPPNKLMDFSQATRIANADAMDRLYWEDSIVGLHTIFLAWMNKSLLRRFWTRDYDVRKMRFEYDYKDVKALQQNELERMQVLSGYREVGVVTGNEVRDRIGLEPSEDPMMDVPLYRGRQLGQDPLMDLAGFGIGGRKPQEPDDEDEEESPTDAEQQRREDAARTDETERAERALAVTGKVVKLRALGSMLERVKMIPTEPLLDLDEEVAIFRKLVHAKLRAMIQRAGEHQLELLGIAGSWDVNAPEALEFLANQEIRVSQEITETTADMIRARVAEFIQDGATVNEMRAGIQDAFKVRREAYQLDRIVRTETHQAQEGGSFMAARQNGVEQKRWITSRDSRVRGLDDDDDADHVGMEQQGAIPMDLAWEDSRTHSLLMFPGDARSSLVEDVVNCRCTWTADFSHLEASLRKDMDDDGYWAAKAERGATLAADLRRTLRAYLIAAERRALARFDAMVRRELERRAPELTGGASNVR